MATAQSPPLWPQPIPIIGVTGEYASGKTLFGLTICPKSTLVYDTEKSAESYQQLGFVRVDVAGEMLRRFPAGYKPVQTWEWWRDHVRSLKPGAYRVVVLDTVSEIESGLVDWVRANPTHFGKTTAQYTRMSGLMWGDVKELWKSVLSDLASRCETFVFASHMSSVWVGDKATGKRKPKGKETLMELASLYLQMERKADGKGAVPEKPAALVLKSRLAHMTIHEDGDIITHAALPPRLPLATPAAIRHYLDPKNAVNYAKLGKGELAPVDVVTDDDRAQVRLATAEAEAEAARLRLEEMERREKLSSRMANREAAAAPQQSPSPAPTPAAPKQEPPAPKPTPPPAAPNGKRDVCGVEHIEHLVKLRAELFERTMPDADDHEKDAAWKSILAKRGVESARYLTTPQADELISKLRHQLEAMDLEAGLEGDGRGPGF